MKMMKLTYPLAFTLALTLAATGCRNHKPIGVTPLPGSNAGMVGDASMGKTLGPDVQATADMVEFEGMAGDRAALAAYTAHFAYDSAAVKKSEKPNIQAVAAALSADASAKLLIEGHCDERGTEEYNRSLGERRALALRSALSKTGVDPSRIRTKSYGKDRPVDTGRDEAAWAKNRRGEFVLLHPKTGV